MTIKKSIISDVCLGVEFNRKQQVDDMGVLDKRKMIFTDMTVKTSIIEYRLNLVDDPPIRSKPYALLFSVLGEIRE